MPAVSDRRPLVGLLAGFAITTLGTRMTAVALPWFVLVSTGSVTRAGLVAFAEMTPYVLVGAIGGPWVDRVGAVRAAVGGNLLAALAVGAVPVLHAAGMLPFGALVGAVAVAGGAGGVAGSGLRVLVPAAGTLAGTPLERVAGLFDGLGRHPAGRPARRLAGRDGRPCCRAGRVRRRLPAGDPGAVRVPGLGGDGAPPGRRARARR